MFSFIKAWFKEPKPKEIKLTPQQLAAVLSSLTPLDKTHVIRKTMESMSIEELSHVKYWATIYSLKRSKHKD
jgi:hypothetical protein